MAKYSFEFKKQVVTEYLKGEGGRNYLAQKHNIPSSTDVKKWVKNYQAFGDEGLKRSRKQQTYSFEYKVHVVVSCRPFKLFERLIKFALNIVHSPACGDFLHFFELVLCPPFIRCVYVAAQRAMHFIIRYLILPILHQDFKSIQAT